MSKLVRGLIPPRTECPYRGECPVAKAGDCYHVGVEHECEFSCALARLIEACKKDDDQ